MRLPEHAHKRIEVAIVLIADVAAESSGLFAIEHHQFRDFGRFASLSIAGDCLFRLRDRRVLVPQYVRPEPPLYRLLVWFQDIRTEAEAGVKKRLVFLARGIEILNQRKQSHPIKLREFRLDGRPRQLVLQNRYPCATQ
jgi:hypothetical protein